jgi:hypothetical protein
MQTGEEDADKRTKNLDNAGFIVKGRGAAGLCVLRGSAWLMGLVANLMTVFRALLQSLQYVRTILAPIKFRRLGEATVENLRQPDQRLKIELGPFRHHAVEHLAAMPPSPSIKTGSCAGAHDRGDVDALLFLPLLFRAHSKVATNVCQYGLMSAKENGHVPLSVRGT